MKRVSAHVLAAVALVSVALVAGSAATVLADANPNNHGHHYGWFKHLASPPPAPQPSPATTPGGGSSASAPSGKVSLVGGSGTPQQNDNGTDNKPTISVIEAPPTIVVVAEKPDDEALWVLYVILAALMIAWLGFAVLAALRSMRGRPRPAVS